MQVCFNYTWSFCHQETLKIKILHYSLKHYFFHFRSHMLLWMIKLIKVIQTLLGKQQQALSRIWRINCGSIRFLCLLKSSVWWIAVYCFIKSYLDVYKKNNWHFHKNYSGSDYVQFLIKQHKLKQRKNTQMKNKSDPRGRTCI